MLRDPTITAAAFDAMARICSKFIEIRATVFKQEELPKLIEEVSSAIQKAWGISK